MSDALGVQQLSRRVPLAAAMSSASCGKLDTWRTVTFNF
jgi:hypothetical protein